MIVCLFLSLSLLSLPLSLSLSRSLSLSLSFSFPLQANQRPCAGVQISHQSPTQVTGVREIHEPRGAGRKTHKINNKKTNKKQTQSPRTASVPWLLWLQIRVQAAAFPGQQGPVTGHDAAVPRAVARPALRLLHVLLPRVPHRHLRKIRECEQ